MSMDDYDLECLPPSIFVGILMGGFISTFISMVHENWFLFVIQWIILFSISVFGGSFIDNKPKQALKLNGMIFGVILMIVSIVFFFVDWNYVIVPLLTLLFILTETIYWSDKKKLGKKNKLLFTAERKGISLLFASLMITALIGFINLSKRLYKIFGLNIDTIIKWIGYIGIGIFWIVLIAAGIMLYLWLNSLKYKRKK